MTSDVTEKCFVDITLPGADKAVTAGKANCLPVRELS
jgi:hypothetical protein